jgi:hypothetical protein
MTYSVELLMDGPAEARVRRLWSALARAGVAGASFLTPNYRPHVSISVFEAGDPESLPAGLRAAAATAVGVGLRLTNVAFFPGPDRLVTFLGVAASAALLDAHARVAASLDGVAAVRPFYLPGAWTPHCTLPVAPATPAEIAATVEVARAAGLPVVATIDCVQLIDTASGEPVTRLA